MTERKDLNEADRKWMEALRPYWGDSMPIWLRKTNGGTEVDAEYMMEQFAKLHGLKPGRKSHG